MQMEGSQILVGWACLESKLCRKVQAGSIPVPSALGELSNWLARQTVNLIPSGLVGSSPTFPTMKFYIGEYITATHDPFAWLADWARAKIAPRGAKVVSGVVVDISKKRLKLLLPNGREEWFRKQECSK